MYCFRQNLAVVAIVIGMHPGGLAVFAQTNSKAPANRPKLLTRSAMLKRFDANADGQFDCQEKRAIIAAFDGVERPILPDRPFDYTRSQVPRYVSRADLHESDNTDNDNPLTNAGATLGRVLFYDRQLSAKNAVSCASCHLQRFAFADPRRFSIGFDGRPTKRNSMGLVNLRYSNLHGNEPGFFWDERAATLEAQVLLPIQDKVEMGMRLGMLEIKLRQLDYYPPLFAAAFGQSKITRERIAKAIAQFMRSLESWDSKFDRAAAKTKQPVDFSIDFVEFTLQENAGKSLFFDGVGGIAELGCAHCHLPPTFGMARAFNIGLDSKYADQGLGRLSRTSNDPFTPSNDGKFKASSLRNVELTAPYMHDGRFKTLEKVVEHYGSGVHNHENLGLALEDAAFEKKSTAGFKFTAKQKAALVAFLKTLTDRRFVGDPRFSDPFVRLESKDK